MYPWQLILGQANFFKKLLINFLFFFFLRTVWMPFEHSNGNTLIAPVLWHIYRKRRFKVMHLLRAVGNSSYLEQSDQHPPELLSMVGLQTVKQPFSDFPNFLAVHSKALRFLLLRCAVKPLLCQFCSFVQFGDCALLLPLQRIWRSLKWFQF